MASIYPSDISRAQFESIRPLLESARKKTKPRQVDLHAVFCGLLYVLKSGCPWRLLPHEYPKGRTVHEYFLQWSYQATDQDESLLEQALKKMCWSGPYPPGATRKNQLLHRRLATC